MALELSCRTQLKNYQKPVVRERERERERGEELSAQCDEWFRRFCMKIKLCDMLLSV